MSGNRHDMTDTSTVYMHPRMSIAILVEMDLEVFMAVTRLDEASAFRRLGPD